MKPHSFDISKAIVEKEHGALTRAADTMKKRKQKLVPVDFYFTLTIGEKKIYMPTKIVLDWIEEGRVVRDKSSKEIVYKVVDKKRKKI